MIISDIQSLSQTPFFEEKQTKPGELGKDAFLRLLVAELKEQDPLNPVDNKDFTAQLAQFTSLEKLENIDKSIQNLSLYQASSTNAASVGFIGKEIEALGNSICVNNGTASIINYSLPADAKNIKLNVYDPNGILVRSIDLGSKEIGNHTFTWDAVNEFGSKVADGIYNFVISADNSLSGIPVQVQTSITGIVKGVSFENGITNLILDERKVLLSDVISIRDVSSTQNSTNNTTYKNENYDSRIEVSRQKASLLNSLNLPLLSKERKILNGI